MSAALQPIATALLDTFSPFERALRDPDQFQVLLRNLGWDRAFEDDVLDGAPLAPIAESAAGLMESGARIVALLEHETDRDPLVDELFQVAEDLQTLIEGLAGIDRDGLPDSLDDEALWAGLALDLPEYLLVRYFERYQPVLYGLLRVAGVIEDDEDALQDGEPGRTPYVRRRIVWDNLVGLAGDPAGHVQQLYHWDDGAPFDHPRLLDELAMLLARTGVPAERLALRPSIATAFFDGTPPPVDARELALPILRHRDGGALLTQGVLVAPVPPSPNRDVDGLYVTNLSWGGATGELALAQPWKLHVSGSLDATGLVGAHIRPGELELETVAGESRAELALEGIPDEPWLLLGAPGGVRLEVTGLWIALVFEGGAEPDVAVELRTLPAGGRGGIAFTIDPGDGDTFMRRLLPDPLTADFDIELRWSARDGFSLGGAGLELAVPVNKTLGPVTLEAIHVGMARDAERASLRLGLTGGLALPPLFARVENAGLALYAETAAAGDGIAGGLALSAGFKPPDAIGFVADVGGVVTGGGYIGHDPALGRYTGALQLEALDVGLAAIVVVDTRLPGDPDGWALFCSLSLTFPGVPLGFGFFLSGVGGLVSLNRTLDVEGFASGLKSGAVNAVLFPDDVLRDAPLIVSQLDCWFPLAEGSAVFGVAAQITWGAPKPIVTGELGIALSFPELDIVVLGSVEMVLPDAEHAQLELHMDALGAIDVSEQTILVVAALYDSTLLNTFSLSGGMAMYGRFGADPYFLLSVGGYHPAWDPPCGLPAAVLDLDRMRLEVTISEDVWYALEAYVAVTSNTLQFGARATVVASAKFLGVTYTARGSVAFNVLLELSPFEFRANFRASVSVTAGSSDKELLAVSLSARLRGPQPWFAAGSASFDFFGLDVPFQIEFGGEAETEAPKRIHLRDAVLAALADASAWRGAAPAGADTGAVLLAVEAGGAGAPVRPDAELEAVQNVAPLERDLDRYNELEIDGPGNLDVTAARIGDDPVEWEAVLDWFSPAQYDDMDDCEKLAAPSYELMTAGVRFGVDSVTVSEVPEHRRTVAPTYEVRIIDREETHDLGVLPLATTLRQATAGLVLDGARRARPRRAVASPTFAVAPTAWSVADAVTGKAVGTSTSYRDALAARRQADPGAVRVAPSHAVGA